MDKEQLQEESEKHYQFILNFVLDYCKDTNERQEFFKHLNGFLLSEISLTELENQ